MSKNLSFRAGRPEDSTKLAILWDAASRGHAAWIWGTMAGPGQSWLEVGSGRVLDMTDAPHHHAKWHVAEAEGQIIGALFGFSIPDPYDQIDLETIHPSFHPMIEMERIAKGCWLLQAVALFPEARGKGHGPALMSRACQAARDAGHRRIVLQVETPNTGAISMYCKCGFAEWERRVFVPFPTSEDEGDWVLMVKDL